jgi:hypothetical protein
VITTSDRTPRWPHCPATPSTAGAGTAMTALAAGGFWYLRNWAWWGHPLHPVGINDPIFGQILVQTGPRAASLWTSLTDLVNARIYDRSGGLSTLSTEVAGWGALAFGCGSRWLMYKEDSKALEAMSSIDANSPEGIAWTRKAMEPGGLFGMKSYDFPEVREIPGPAGPILTSKQSGLC